MIADFVFIAFLTVLFTVIGGVIVLLILATPSRKEDLQTIKLREYFKELFSAECSNSEYVNPPLLIKIEQETAFLKSYHFKSLIPLELWNRKKGYIEMYLNERVLEIFQWRKKPQFLTLATQTHPLPEHIIWNDLMLEHGNFLVIGVALGGITGMDLEMHPHAFVAGETGSGKSNILKCMIHQAILKRYDVILIDFKRGVSFAEFSDRIAIFYEYKEVIGVLKYMVSATITRLDKFRNAGVDNINDYNRYTNDYMSRKIIFIDELAELLRTRDKEISTILYDCIETLTRLSRAVGIHLIMGIQRPDSTIVSGQIKNNVSYRVCGRFVDKEPSRIVLGCDKSSTLPNIKGRFLIKDDYIYEVQCFYFQSQRVQPRQLSSVESPPQVTPPLEVQEEVEPVISPVVVNADCTTEKQANDFEFDFSDMKKK